VIHLYALTRTVVPAPLRGIDEATLSTVAVGELHAVISRHPGAVRPTEAAALRHVAVIEALAEQADVLPLRFGSQHDREDDLRRRLEGSLPQLRVLLDRVGGHLEFVVRPAAAVAHDARSGLPQPLREDPAETGTTGSGRAYLERRLAEERVSAQELAAARASLHEVTDELVPAAAAVHDLTSPRGPERCFLVARSAAASFGARARHRLDDSERFVVAGPWPPFTFASPDIDAEVAR
jgi:hypothetical protein